MLNPPLHDQTADTSCAEIGETTLAYHYVMLPQTRHQTYLAHGCAEVLRSTNMLLGDTRYTWDILDPSPGRFDTSRSVLVLLGDPGAFWRPEPEDRGMLNTAIRHASRLCLVGGAVFVPIEAGAITSKCLAVPPGLVGELAELRPDIQSSLTATWHHRRVSSAVGPAAALRMMVDLVATADGKMTGRAVAQVLGLEDPSESDPMCPQLRKVDGDPLLTDAVTFMLAHVEDTVSIQQIAGLIGTSPRQLERRFRERTTKSPAKFYRDIRLDHARNLIARGNLALPDVAISSGFSCSSLLRKWYRHRFGEAPESTIFRVRHGVRPQ